MAKEAQLSEFSQYMTGLLDQAPGSLVVEVGTDQMLRLARNLAGHCDSYVALTMPEDYDRAEFSLDMLGGRNSNIKLVGHNAMQLGEVVELADFVVVHNVLLELEPGDTALMWAYRRGELPCTDEEWEALRDKFGEAERQGYAEFNRVAAEGMVVDFHRKVPEGEKTLASFLIENSIATDERVSTVPLLYDDGEARDDEWEATVIDNRAA